MHNAEEHLPDLHLGPLAIHFPVVQLAAERLQRLADAGVIARRLVRGLYRLRGDARSVHPQRDQGPQGDSSATVLLMNSLPLSV